MHYSDSKLYLVRLITALGHSRLISFERYWHTASQTKWQTSLGTAFDEFIYRVYASAS
jgi:hypothetical protein